MKNIMLFEENKVEVFELNGKVLFNPYDVGRCLDIKDVKSTIRNFSDKQLVKITNSKVGTMHFRKLHNTGENFLTESGVYKLIFKSRKKEAEKFQDWVTDEVLPSIRKNGFYATEQVAKEFLKDPKALEYTLKELIKQHQINDLLSDGVISKDKRNVLNKVVRTLASSNHIKIGVLWNELYDEMLKEYKIDLKSRGKSPYIQHIKEIEVESAIHSLFEISKNYTYNLEEILEYIKGKDENLQENKNFDIFNIINNLVEK